MTIPKKDMCFTKSEYVRQRVEQKLFNMAFSFMDKGDVGMSELIWNELLYNECLLHMRGDE